MGSIGLPEILLIALVALLLFGAGRIADIGKGLGQGIKNFKQGLKDADAVDKDGDKSDEKTSAKKADKDDAKSESKSEAKAKEA
jgi:sec-independent protein translocase protein TatA